MLKQNIEAVKNSLKRLSFPKDVIIETSSICNLNCIMCPQYQVKRKNKFMELGLYKKIIDEIECVSSDTAAWVAVMGEPLLNPLIFEMMRYSLDRGIETNLNTNLSSIDDFQFNELINTSPSTIIVGLDAVSLSTYKKIRRGGDFAKIVYYTLELISAGQNVIVQFIEMDENAHEIDEFKQYWLDAGAAVKLRPRLGWGSGVKAGYLNVPKEERFPCPWLMRTVSIHSDGMVAQCDGDYAGKYYAGDINKQTILEIWENELLKKREKHWNNIFDTEPCNNCLDWQAGRSHFYYPEVLK